MRLRKEFRMVDEHDPRSIANSWHQAAEKVAALRRDDLDPNSATWWNDAIDHAVGVLRKEADDVVEMGRMAHLLIVGNIAPEDDDGSVTKSK